MLDRGTRLRKHCIVKARTGVTYNRKDTACGSLQSLAHLFLSWIDRLLLSLDIGRRDDVVARFIHAQAATLLPWTFVLVTLFHVDMICCIQSQIHKIISFHAASLRDGPSRSALAIRRTSTWLDLAFQRDRSLAKSYIHTCSFSNNNTDSKQASKMSMTAEANAKGCINTN